jgi:Zn-dependent alcohol dehydrogenase
MRIKAAVFVSPCRWCHEGRPNLCDIPWYVDLLLKGKLDMDSLITNHYRLDDINTCVQNLLDGNKAGRQVIRFS